MPKLINVNSPQKVPLNTTSLFDWFILDGGGIWIKTSDTLDNDDKYWLSGFLHNGLCGHCVMHKDAKVTLINIEEIKYTISIPTQ